MNLFTKSLSLFYWFSLSICAATGDNSSIGNTELDFLNNDLNIVELSKDDIEKAFCINDVHGKEHKQFVNEFLKTFLGDQESKCLSLCILNKIVETIQNEKYDSFEFHECKVTASLIDSNGKKILDKSHSLIYNFILQFISVNNERFSLKIDNLYVEVKPSAENQFVETVETPRTTSHEQNPATNINEVLSEGSTLGESMVTRQFEVVKNDVIKNLKSFMNELKNVSNDSSYKILSNVARQKKLLTQEGMEDMIAILPRTIFSKKFSIVPEKKND